jgi:long-chain acyl-CoA synthetase
VSELRDRLAQLLGAAPPEADAVTFDDVWWTWGDLQRLARSVTDHLNSLGLGAGARVGVMLENRPEHVAVVLAVLGSGRCLTTLSGLQPPERLAADIRLAATPVVIGSPQILDQPGIRAAIQEAGCDVALDLTGTLTGSVSSCPETSSWFADSDTAIEMLTSGTTGPPKRVRLTDNQLDVSMHSAHIRARTVDGKPRLGSGVSIISTPLVHIGGLWGVLSAAFAGRRMVLLARFRLEEWVHAIETYRPRAAGLVPAAMRAVLDAGIEPKRLSSLQVVTSGTAPCPPDLAEAFTDRYGISVLMTYGATEFAGAVAGWTLRLHEEWWERKKGSAGHAFPGVKLRIVDDDGVVLDPFHSGHLEVLTKQSPNGGTDWIRTSDLAHLDDDDFLWISGRADDAIIRGGFKVHPEVVKRVLEQHPGVQEAAVAGIADVRLGAVPVAAVERRPGGPEPTSDDLTMLCREHLTPYEVPVAFRVVDDLPRTPSMKVSRVELLELFADNTTTPAAASRTA